MELEDFIKLGLTLTEAKLYMYLLRRAKMDAKTIIKETELHKKIVYDNLDKLIQKGLVSAIIIDGRRVYQTTNVDALQQLVDEQQEEVAKKQTLVNTLTKEIGAIQKEESEDYQATLYQGVKGIKTVLKQVLEEEDDYVAFGGPKESLEMLGETFWLNFQEKQYDIGMDVRVIFNDSLRDWSKQLGDKKIKIKFLPTIEPLTETIVVKDITAIIIWTANPIATVIKSGAVAASYKSFFEVLWETAHD